LSSKIGYAYWIIIHVPMKIAFLGGFLPYLETHP